MTQHHLTKIGGAFLLSVAIFGLSNDRGSANVDPDDRKLEAFVEAAAAVDSIMASWQPKITRADSNDAAALRHQANIEIRRSIEQTDGISLSEYRKIRRELATDPDILARVIDIMRQHRQH